MYDRVMKPITIMIPEELDQRAADEAHRRGVSKSELMRQAIDAILPAPREQPEEEDLLYSLAGFGPPDAQIAPGEIDEVVYDGR